MARASAAAAAATATALQPKAQAVVPVIAALTPGMAQSLAATLLRTSEQLMGTRHFAEAAYCLHAITCAPAGAGGFDDATVKLASMHAARAAAADLWHNTLVHLPPHQRDLSQFQNAVNEVLGIAMTNNHVDVVKSVMLDTIHAFFLSGQTSTAIQYARSAVSTFPPKDVLLVDHVRFGLLLSHLLFHSENNTAFDTLKSFVALIAAKDSKSQAREAITAAGLPLYADVLSLAMRLRDGRAPLPELQPELKRIADGLAASKPPAAAAAAAATAAADRDTWLNSALLDVLLRLMTAQCVRSEGKLADTHTALQACDAALTKFASDIAAPAADSANAVAPWRAAATATDTASLAAYRALFFALRTTQFCHHLNATDFMAAANVLSDLVDRCTAPPERVEDEINLALVHVLCGEYVVALNLRSHALAHFHRATQYAAAHTISVAAVASGAADTVLPPSEQLLWYAKLQEALLRFGDAPQQSVAKLHELQSQAQKSAWSSPALQLCIGLALGCVASMRGDVESGKPLLTDASNKGHALKLQRVPPAAFYFSARLQMARSNAAAAGTKSAAAAVQQQRMDKEKSAREALQYALRTATNAQDCVTQMAIHSLLKSLAAPPHRWPALPDTTADLTALATLRASDFQSAYDKVHRSALYPKIVNFNVSAVAVAQAQAPKPAAATAAGANGAAAQPTPMSDDS